MSKKHKRAKPQPAQTPQAADAVTSVKPHPRISSMALAASSVAPTQRITPWIIPKPPPGVAPASATMAMDEGFADLHAYAGGGYGSNVGFGEGLHFVGYPLLSEMAQRVEYRRMVSVLAQEMTRRWCKLTSSSDEDKTDKIQQIEAALRRYRVQDVFREAAEADGFFGIGHIYIDMGVTDPDELKTPLFAKPEKIGRGKLKRIRTVEPLWCYPGMYNSNDPLAADFYKPHTWYCMSREVHHTRLLSLVSREVPDILKPSYCFGGISLTQIARPTVDNWLRTRTSISDLLHSFTIWQLKTNLGATLAGVETLDMIERAQLFNQFRDNRGLMMVDKETEELGNISVPLGGLEALQAQAQQHMAAVCGIPLTKLLGTPPQGLNASSEGEITSFYDTIGAMQRHLFNAPLKQIMDIIQLSELGAIDEDISFEWENLQDPNEAERAAVRKTDIDSAVELIAAGVISPEEERQRLADSEESLYHGIDVNDLPDPPEQEEKPSLLSDPAKGMENKSED
jgi:phage-related protein (TIGR01555 family)